LGGKPAYCLFACVSDLGRPNQSEEFPVKDGIAELGGGGTALSDVDVYHNQQRGKRLAAGGRKEFQFHRSLVEARKSAGGSFAPETGRPKTERGSQTKGVGWDRPVLGGCFCTKDGGWKRYSSSRRESEVLKGGGGWR